MIPERHHAKTKSGLFIIAIVAVLAGLASAAGLFRAPDARVEPEAGEPRFEQVLAGGTTVSFEYPAELGTEYIRLVDWPPAARIVDEPFACAEAGEAADRAGKTQARMLGGTEYCVTEVLEGAAGSVYAQYAYARAYGDKTFILTFSTRATQCGNYDEEERAFCEAERATFGADDLVADIEETLRFEEPESPDAVLPAGPMVLEGASVCLPHKDMSGPQTLECAFGIRADDGSHYAISTYGLDADTVMKAQTSARIRAEGHVVPVQALSSDIWMKYDIIGIMQAERLIAL